MFRFLATHPRECLRIDIALSFGVVSLLIGLFVIYCTRPHPIEVLAQESVPASLVVYEWIARLTINGLFVFFVFSMIVHFLVAIRTLFHLLYSCCKRKEEKMNVLIEEEEEEDGTTSEGILIDADVALNDKLPLLE